MAAAAPLIHPRYVRSEELGREITELCGYIYAATYQLLVKTAQGTVLELGTVPIQIQRRKLPRKRHAGSAVTALSAAPRGPFHYYGFTRLSRSR